MKKKCHFHKFIHTNDLLPYENKHYVGFHYNIEHFLKVGGRLDNLTSRERHVME